MWLGIVIWGTQVWWGQESGAHKGEGNIFQTLGESGSVFPRDNLCVVPSPDSSAAVGSSGVGDLSRAMASNFNSLVRKSSGWILEPHFEVGSQSCYNSYFDLLLVFACLR